MALAKERIRQTSQDPSSSLEFFGSEGHHHLPTLFDPSNSSSYDYLNSLPHEAQTSAHHWAYSSSSSSVLSFEQAKLDQEDECALWVDTMDSEHQPSFVNRDVSCFEMASGYGSVDRHRSEGAFGLLYQDGGEVESSSQKRPYMVLSLRQVNLLSKWIFKLLLGLFSSTSN